MVAAILDDGLAASVYEMKPGYRTKPREIRVWGSVRVDIRHYIAYFFSPGAPRRKFRGAISYIALAFASERISRRAPFARSLISRRDPHALAGVLRRWYFSNEVAPIRGLVDREIYE